MRSPALAWGSLELLWHSAYEAGDDLIGTDQDVEDVMCWRGRKGDGCRMVVDAGFIDRDDAGLHRIHDLWDHAPEYVRKRRVRESARKGRQGPSTDSTNGGRTADERRTDGGHMDAIRARGSDPTPVAARIAARIAAHTPSGGPSAPPSAAEVCDQDGWSFWDRWREVAETHGAPQPLVASPKQWDHIKALTESYTPAQLDAVLAAWWDSPHTGGRSLGLFRDQVPEVLAHLAQHGHGRFRAPKGPDPETPPMTLTDAQAMLDRIAARKAMR